MCTATQRALPAVLAVTSWSDPVVEANGFGPDDPYIENTLLARLGPSAVMLWKRLARQVLDTPAVQVDTSEMLSCLGLGQGRGRNDVGARTLGRVICFNLARYAGAGDTAVAVRTAVAALPAHRARSLPLPARLYHQAVTEGAGPRFRLGRLHVSAAALRAMTEAHADPAVLLTRHQHADWGYVNIDRALANNSALSTEQAVKSVYPLPDAGEEHPGVVVIETNGARTSTTIRSAVEDPEL